MLHKKITYTDYDGNTRTEDHYFNLSKAELMEMATSENGGMDKVLEKIIAEQDTKRIIHLIKELITKSYGEKSNDGKRFIKSEELTTAFMQTEAFSNLYMELVSDAEKAAEFVNGIVPADVAAQAQAMQNNKLAAAN